MTVGFLSALAGHARKRPADIAITLRTGGRSADFTYAGLAREAARWAQFLSSRGAAPGDVVLIVLPLSVDAIHAFLGAAFAGCVPSFMPCPSAKQDPVLYWSSHNALFARIGGGFIVTSRANANAVAANIVDAKMTIVAADECSRESHWAELPARPRQGSEYACLQHSSGTTGLKKGVLLTFAQIEAQVSAYRAVLNFDESSTVVSWLPLYHDMGFVACFLLPLSAGARIVMLDPFEWVAGPLALFEAIETYKGQFVWLPNFALNHLVNAAGDDERRSDLSSVRAFVDCSEPCVARSLADFETRFRSWGLGPNRTLTCYAMAETVFAAAQSAPGRRPRLVRLKKGELDRGIVALAAPSDESAMEVPSSGTPLPGVEIVVLDEGKRPAAADRVGQIAIRAPFLFEGYYMQPERTLASFHQGFFLTGDMGFTREGDVFVLGRLDDVIVLSGRSVFAGEIEDIVSRISGIRAGRVYAFGQYDDAIGTRELIVVAEREDSVADLEALRKAVRLRVNGMLGLAPRRVKLVDAGWIVKSTSGKLNRPENMRKYEAAFAKESHVHVHTISG